MLLSVNFPMTIFHKWILSWIGLKKKVIFCVRKKFNCHIFSCVDKARKKTLKGVYSYHHTLFLLASLMITKSWEPSSLVILLTHTPFLAMNRQSGQSGLVLSRLLSAPLLATVLAEMVFGSPWSNFRTRDWLLVLGSKELQDLWLDLDTTWSDLQSPWPDIQSYWSDLQSSWSDLHSPRSELQNSSSDLWTAWFDLKTTLFSFFSRSVLYFGTLGRGTPRHITSNSMGNQRICKSFFMFYVLQSI